MTRRGGLDGQPSKMDESQSLDELDDRTFERLFASLDDVHASDGLKASTLAAIFEQFGEDEQIASAQSDDTVEKTVERSPLSLVSNNPQTRDAQTDRRTRRPKHARSAARPRRQNAMLRAAAVLLVVILGIGGGTAYALPASHVLVSVEDTTFDLGVNVFGLTVSATADTEDGTEVIDEADLRNRGFEDSFDRLLAKYEDKRGAEPQNVTFRVDERFGAQGAKIKREAERVVERRAEAPESTQGQPQAAPNGGDNGSAGNGGKAGNGNAMPTMPSEPATSEPATSEPAASEPATPAQSDAPSPAATDAREGEPAQAEERPSQQMSDQGAGEQAANEPLMHGQGGRSERGGRP